MKQFRAGLIGAGYISEYHVAALRRLPDVEIVGVTDLDQGKAAVLAERFGLRSFSSSAALADAGANVMHVLTPPESHALVTLDALDRGCHVLVEKPLAVDVDDCRRIEQRSVELNRRVCVNHSLLHDPNVRKALNDIRSGRIGRVVSVDILRSSVYPPYPGGTLPPQYRTAGYPFRDLGIHALYLFEAFLGPIEDVSAQWASLGGDPNLAFDEWRASVRCRDGLGQFQLSWNVKPIQSQIIVQGTSGVLRCDLFLMFQAVRSLTRLPKAAERVINTLQDALRPLVSVPVNVGGFALGKVRPYQGLQGLVAAFYESLQSGGSEPVSVADASRVVNWTERIARRADAEYADHCRRFQLSERVPVLITGASGGLGSAVVERLRSRGQRVRILVRRAPADVATGIEVALGDLGDPKAVDRAVRGAAAVVHVGAAMKGGPIEHQCATVVGTQNVLDSCVRHHVQKFVHVSSLSVVDWAGARRGDPITETSSFEPRPNERGSYTQAKLEAERMVARCQGERGLASVILRPGQIFGGRINLMTGAVARKRGRRWLVLGDGKLRLPLVYIDDVVDAIVSALDSGVNEGQVIQLVDEEVPTQDEVLHLMFGPRVGVLHVPRALLFVSGKVSEWVLGLLGRQSPLSLYRLRSALARRTFKSSNAWPLLSWKPRVGWRRGIEIVSRPADPHESGGDAPTESPKKRETQSLELTVS